jgi:hypothetical protein
MAVCIDNAGEDTGSCASTGARLRDKVKRVKDAESCKEVSSGGDYKAEGGARGGMASESGANESVRFVLGEVSQIYAATTHGSNGNCA